MNPIEQRKAAKAFVERWKAAEGSEDRESDDFWFELFQEVLGVRNPTRFLDRQRKVQSRKIDLFIEDTGVLIENKSRGVDLDAPEQRGKDKYGNPRMVTPFEQAKWYADNMPRSISPRWVITCNFDEMRIYDLDEEWPERAFDTIALDELAEQYHRLAFMVKKENSRAERERALSVAAGVVVGKLYDAFAEAYIDIENDEVEQRSLNILVTRIVFLLYAEDADLLHERDAFYKYLKNFQVVHMRQALVDLFATLNTPVEERDRYLSPELASFPYVNGGLFKDDIIIPHFTEDTRFILLQEASAEFDWSGISPTIFGAVFESTLNPETRRTGGMHYTSVENIHKLTGPLFYDALKAELDGIQGAKGRSEKERRFKLNEFRKKIASLTCADYSCGSGNFLTETYLSLRKLENRVLEDLYGDQMALGLDNPIMVSIDQFYGIEINEFAVEVARTALWIAELQMLDQTREILDMWIDPLPLKSNENIHCGNALRMDWNDVLPAEECSYIIGNPPFVGHQWRSQEQQEDMDIVFEGYSKYGKLDYVCAWYAKAVDYISGSSASGAFVSTNSICQGESVRILWEQLAERGLVIDFAWPSFKWSSEVSDQAGVAVVIVGFSVGVGRDNKVIYYTHDAKRVAHINGYLIDGPDVYIQGRGKPLNPGSPEMTKGSQPTDGGQLILKEDERAAMVSKHPELAEVIRQYMGGDEFIKGKKRYCFWFDGVDIERFRRIPEVEERLAAVREARLGSPTASVRKDAGTPWLFTQRRQPSERFMAIPEVSSENRDYIPVGFVEPDVIASNQLRFVPTNSMYLLGLAMSKAHMAWMRVVSGKLESRYRYSPAVWNSFIWPDSSIEQREEIERCAQAVLDIRDNYHGKSLADLYDPGKMPDDLLTAHKALDKAVEDAYGVDFGGDEEKIVAHLFKLYAEAVASE